MDPSYKKSGMYVLPQRLNGNNRYSTAEAIADYMFSSSRYAAFAAGEDYPDTLSGSVLASFTKSPVVPVSSDIDKPTEDYILENQAQIFTCSIFGGTGTAGDNVFYRLFCYI